MTEDIRETNPNGEETTNQGAGFKNTLAAAYSKATTAYDHVMAPIREINAYVDEKNELDRQKESGELSEDMYNQNVEALQKETFGEDLKNLSIANKFEAVADWKEAHGIGKIEDSFHGMTASIGEAFSKTALGQKFAEIKQLAAEMGGVHTEVQTADGPEAEKPAEEVTTSNAMEGDSRYKAPAAPNAMAGDPRYEAPATSNAMAGDARYAAAEALTADIQMDGADDLSAEAGM